MKAQHKQEAKSSSSFNQNLSHLQNFERSAISAYRSYTTLLPMYQRKILPLVNISLFFTQKKSHLELVRPGLAGIHGRVRACGLSPDHLLHAFLPSLLAGIVRN